MPVSLDLFLSGTSKLFKDIARFWGCQGSDNNYRRLLCMGHDLCVSNQALELTTVVDRTTFPLHECTLETGKWS